jgi:hypothetical protein
MAGEKLQELVKKQAKIISNQAALIEKQAETISKKIPVRLHAPPSDIVKPQPTNDGKKRKSVDKRDIKNMYVPFPPDQFDQFIEVILEVCPECGGPLHECEEVVTKQQIDIVEKPFIVT